MTVQHIKARLATALAVVAIAGLFQAAAAHEATVESALTAGHVGHPAAQPALTAAEEKWGVRIVGIRMSAGGLMLDFRYRVIDPEKAAPILDRQNRPYLIDQASGTVVEIASIPAIGRMRQNTMRPEAGRGLLHVVHQPRQPEGREQGHRRGWRLPRRGHHGRGLMRWRGADHTQF